MQPTTMAESSLTLVIGMGASGQAVARRLQAEGRNYVTYDDRAKDAPPGLTPIRHLQAPDLIGAVQFDQAVISPGVPLNHPGCRILYRMGTPPISEIEFASQRIAGRVIGVTGSNGKSTTVSLIHHILSGNGLSARLCGNIGRPFTDAITADPNDIFVLELSSFQLETITTFAPCIAVLLNVTPDHMDRHGSLESYRAAKLRIFERQTRDDHALFGAELNHAIPGAAAKIPIPGPHHRLLTDGIHIGSGFTLRREDFPLIGPHNAENLLFAAAVAQLMGLSDDQVAASLTSFRGLEHRLEVVGRYADRIWINDSKATNNESTQAAIDSMTGPFVLILGGSDKGNDFSSLRFPQPLLRRIIAYGETGPQIMRDLTVHHPLHVPQFEDALTAAYDASQPGDTILLSPACASFDQFENFKARGKGFKQLVHTHYGAAS